MLHIGVISENSLSGEAVVSVFSEARKGTECLLRHFVFVLVK